MSRVTPSDSWQRARSKTAAITAFKRPVRPVAKGSRRVTQLSGSYVYFLVLERSWWYAITLALGLYVISIAVCALVASTGAPREHAARAGRGHFDVVAPRWEKCLRFAAAHVLTMSWGSVVPVDRWSHVLSWLQIALGLLVNVFVFSVVVAKFQAPQSDLVWSEGCVILSRDGVPHLLMRVGNLRCHTLYSPRIRLTLLRRHVTQEGESSLVQSPGRPQRVDQPSRRGDVGHSHRRPRDRRSVAPPRALRERCAPKGRRRSSADPRRRASVRQRLWGDLSATHTYGKGSLLEGAFADMIRSEGGRTTIDWDAFNATRPLGSPVRDADPGAFSAPTWPALHLVRQCPRLVRHGQRARRRRAPVGARAVLSLLDAPVSVIGRGRR